MKCSKGRGVILSLTTSGTSDRLKIHTKQANSFCRSSKATKGPIYTTYHLVTLHTVLTNSRKQENYFPLEAHQYNITAFAPTTAGGHVLWDCKPSGCEAGGGRTSLPCTNTDPGAITQERSKELGVNRSSVVGARGLFYLPSFPLFSNPHCFFTQLLSVCGSC